MPPKSPQQRVVGQSASEEAFLYKKGYNLIKKLGEGSYAKVYLSDYNAPNRSERNVLLACKVVDTSKAPRDFVQRFLPRELDVMRRLKHPHVVMIHSIFQLRNKTFVFMRFAELGTLLDIIKANPNIPEEQNRIWFKQIVAGVRYMHTINIAHRDLKCENVLVSGNYNMKVADFGFARVVADKRGRIILSETYCGSLSYTAPEIIKGRPYNPIPTDVWSLGIMLYVMTNKSMPFDDSNVRRMLDLQMARKWKFRPKFEQQMSVDCKKVVIGTLEPDVPRRWGTSEILQSKWMGGRSNADDVLSPKIVEGKSVVVGSMKRFVGKLKK